MCKTLLLDLNRRQRLLPSISALVVRGGESFASILKTDDDRHVKSLAAVLLEWFVGCCDGKQFDFVRRAVPFVGLLNNCCQFNDSPVIYINRKWVLRSISSTFVIIANTTVPEDWCDHDHDHRDSPSLLCNVKHYYTQSFLHLLCVSL